jgi:hypothetical protein
MDQTNPPDHIEPPSSARLLRSTAKAALVAVALLVTIVLPAEFGIDPTGLGRLLGLKEVGEIKMQLAAEAEAEEATTTAALDEAASARLDAIESRLDEIQGLLATREAIEVAASAAESALPEPAGDAEWRDEITITLTPGQGVEYKLVMLEGAEAEFEWTANGGALNYDTHGSGGGNSISYEQGRGEPEGSGVIVAAFDGNHGWFFRNRTDVDVQLTLRTRGDYSEFRRTV